MNTVYQLQPLTLGDVATYPLASRKSKVSIADFAEPVSPNAPLTKFLDSLPAILAAADFRAITSAIHAAKRQRRTILSVERWGRPARQNRRWRLCFSAMPVERGQRPTRTGGEADTTYSFWKFTS